MQGMHYSWLVHYLQKLSLSDQGGLNILLENILLLENLWRMETIRSLKPLCGALFTRNASPLFGISDAISFLHVC